MGSLTLHVNGVHPTRGARYGDLGQTPLEPLPRFEGLADGKNKRT